MKVISPALRVRLGLKKGHDFDVRHSHIEICIDSDTGKHVRTCLPVSDFPEGATCNPKHPLYHRYDITRTEQAASLWRHKYGAEIPSEIDIYWAETLSASTTPYDGLTPLTASEHSVINRASEFGDFTLDMLWLIVECLDWRPGKPVSEEDPGWIAVWAEEQEQGNYLHIVRAVLGMPEVEYGWKPPAVVALESN
jgi:hypothetical protein